MQKDAANLRASQGIGKILGIVEWNSNAESKTSPKLYWIVLGRTCFMKILTQFSQS